MNDCASCQGFLAESSQLLAQRLVVGEIGFKGAGQGNDSVYFWLEFPVRVGLEFLTGID
jgi:hypothetical protein